MFSYLKNSKGLAPIAVVGIILAHLGIGLWIYRWAEPAPASGQAQQIEQISPQPVETNPNSQAKFAQEFSAALQRFGTEGEARKCIDLSIMSYRSAEAFYISKWEREKRQHDGP